MCMFSKQNLFEVSSKFMLYVSVLKVITPMVRNAHGRPTL